MATALSALGTPPVQLAELLQFPLAAAIKTQGVVVSVSVADTVPLDEKLA